MHPSLNLSMTRLKNLVLPERLKPVCVKKQPKKQPFSWPWPPEPQQMMNLSVLTSQSGFSSCPVHPTLALMMVGLGSKMPCIFLKAGMTKRLQVTTADTGFPRTDRWTERGGREERKKREKFMSNISSETSEWITLSLNFTHYLGGQRLVCEHCPCPRWQMLLGDWKWKTTFVDFDFNTKKSIFFYQRIIPVLFFRVFVCSMPHCFKCAVHLIFELIMLLNPFYFNLLWSTW